VAWYVVPSAASVVAAVGVLWWSVTGIVSARGGGRSTLTMGLAPLQDVREIDLARPARERLVEPIAAAIARRARRMTPAGVVAATHARIERAGLGGRITVDQVLVTKVALANLALFLGVVRTLVAPSLGVWVLCALLGGLGYLVPDALLDRRARERAGVIERELADTLDQVTITVEAGLGFEAALARVARSGDGPLAADLARLLQDIHIGVPRDVAFEHLAARTDVADLRQFVVALRQAERHGLPIAQVLRVQAAELREKRRLRAEERAQKIPVKMIFPLVCFILPALFVVIIGPAALRFAETFG
jgi:tight adherence protein C